MSSNISSKETEGTKISSTIQDMYCYHQFSERLKVWNDWKNEKKNRKLKEFDSVHQIKSFEETIFAMYK